MTFTSDSLDEDNVVYSHAQRYLFVRRVKGKAELPKTLSISHHAQKSHEQYATSIFTFIFIHLQMLLPKYMQASVAHTELGTWAFLIFISFEFLPEDYLNVTQHSYDTLDTVCPTTQYNSEKIALILR